MNTEFDGDDEGSSRGNCVLIASEPKREQDRTALGSQPPRQNSAYLRGLHPIGQKNRTCIGSHPWRAEARILAEKTSYVRRSGVESSKTPYAPKASPGPRPAGGMEFLSPCRTYQD